MSLDKVVLCATATSSIGALASENTLQKYFQLIDSSEAMSSYFSSETEKPFYLSHASLISECIAHFLDKPELLLTCGVRFGNFFRMHLSDAKKSAGIQLAFMG